MLYKKKFLIFLSLATLIFLIPVMNVFAQTPQSPLNITLSPVYYDFSANPGQTIKSTIKLQNNTLTPMQLSIGIKKIITDTNGNITIRDLSPQDITGTWFHFASATISALPQEVTNIPFTLTIPKDAAYGYYVAIAFTQNSPKTKSTEGVSATAAIPVLLNVRSPGSKTQATIVNFKAKEFMNEFMPVEFITSIKNTGNIHIRPTGSIFIRNGSDKDLAIIDVNKAGGDIIPGQIRTFPANWDDGFIVREPVMEDGAVKTDTYGHPITHLVLHWDRITSMRFGEYTASLLVVYDNGTRDVALEANTSFWLIPYTAIAIIIISIIVFILFIRFFLKWYVKRALKKYQEK